MTDLRDRLQSTLGGNYTLERELGGGGMSRVFVAHDTVLKRRVVVKVLSPELAAGVSAERFRREIELAAQLQHPHIVPVLTTGETDGLPFYTMPYVDGESLRAKLTHGPLSVAETIRILRDVASSLAYAHSHGIIHRDIKPDNILLSDGYAVVTDLGIAKALRAARTGDIEALTQTGVVVGTPAYMAPEQAFGDDAVDHRADIYALGCLGYELLTGKPPFHAASFQQIVQMHMQLTPQPISAQRANVPSDLAELLQKCLAKDPAHRYQRADEIVEALDGIPSGGGGLRIPRPVKRAALLAACLAIAMFAALRFSRGGGSDASIVVLPFETGGDTGSTYFAEGIADEITTALQKTTGLRVAPRTSALALSRRGLAADSIAKTLGMRTVLAGIVRRDGNRLRISTELTDVRKGEVLWAERFEREKKDIFRVQDDIASAIASALRVRLGGGATASAPGRATADVEAYDLYLRGRYFWTERSQAGLARAIEYFHQAIVRDSTFAPAISGLADAYAVSAFYSYVTPQDGFGRAKDLAARALMLDSTRAEPHASLGYVAMYYEWNFPQAEMRLRRAIALDGNYATAHQWLGNYLVAMGRFDEGIEEFRRAWQIDPLNRITAAALCWAMYLARRTTEAIAQCTRAVEVDSAFAVGHFMKGLSHFAQRDSVRALAEFRRSVALSNRSSVTVANLAIALASFGRKGEARELIPELTSPKSGYAPSYEIAQVHGALGDTERAFTWLDRAFRERSHSLVLVNVDPMLDPLRGDPRLKALSLRVGLPQTRD